MDLRLVPSAVVAWMVAWGVTGGVAMRDLAAACGWLAGLVVACLVLRAVLRISRGAAGQRRSHVNRYPFRNRQIKRQRQGQEQRQEGGQPRGVSIAVHAALATGCALAVVASGTVAAARSAPLADLAGGGFTAELTGTVRTEPVPFTWGGAATGAVSSGLVRYVLDVERLAARSVESAADGHVQVVSPSAAALQFGSVVTVRGRLEPPLPGWTETATTTADSVAVQQRPPAALRFLDRHRAALMKVTDDLSPQARGLVPGAAIGDTTRLPENLDDAMKQTGLTHITAVSGGHFAIVMMLLTGLAGTVGAPRWARVALLAVAGTAFVALVRPEPSVVRAAVMAMFALAGMLIGRRSQSVPALAGTVIGLLVIDPTLARSYGFALSAAATAGIVLLVPPLVARIAPWTGKAFGFALAVPWAAQLACGPILVLLDPVVSLVSVPANLLAAPAVVPATILGLAATVVAPWWPWAAHGIAWLAGGATWWIAQVALHGAALPGAVAPWPGGLLGALLLAGTTAAALALVLAHRARGWPESWRHDAQRRFQDLTSRLRRPRPDRGPAPLLVGILLTAGAIGAVVLAAPRLVRAETPADWVIAACDVGQGDTTVLRTGPESALVIDVGPDSDAAGHCLDELGVTRIDLLVLSHFHADHVGGLKPVLNGRDVQAALVSALRDPPANAEYALGELATAGVPVRAAVAGDTGVAGSVTWEVLQSGVPLGSVHRQSESMANDSSVTLLARTAGADIVLLGDLEDVGQAALVPEVQRREIADVDVVKVAHHGSADQSSQLAAQLSPDAALISVGEDNSYGHPTDTALDLYAGTGAEILRTDECGTVTLVVRGEDLAVAGC